MSDLQIMDKVIRKALEQGYEDWWDTPFTIKDISAAGFLEVEVPDDPDLLGWGFHQVHINEVIYNHDFAKALWSFEPVQTVECYRPHLLKEWQWHLQQMVIADDPIKYLGENL